MILSDKDIKKEIKNKNIVIEPFKKERVQPASVDLLLGKDFIVYNTEENFVVDTKKLSKNLTKKITIKKDGFFVLQPGCFALGLIYEKTGVANNIVGRLEGKSSLARLGLIIHTTAGFLDPGNCLNMTLELFNAGPLPIKLYYKMPIGQMAFEYLSSECERPYGTKGLNSKYKGDEGVMFSKMDKNKF